MKTSISLLLAFLMLMAACQKTHTTQQTGDTTTKTNLTTTYCTFPNQHTIAMDSALALLSSDGNGNFTRFTNMWGGSLEFEISSAIATLAIDIARGNRTTTIVNKYVEVVKQMVNNYNQNPEVTGGLECREQGGAYYSIALGWRQADIKARFTAAEQAKIKTMMKAAVAAGAFVMAKYIPTGTSRSDQRVAMDGNTDTYSSPNYAEGYSGAFLAGMTVMGKDSVDAFLNTYNHTNFLAELSSNGLTKVYNIFNKLFNVTVSGNVYDASTSAKKATLIESYLQSIDNNDNLNKYFYRSLKLSQITADPVQLTSKLTIFCYDAIATEGDFVGQTGMAQELDGTDASGTRSSIFYAAAGMINNTYSRFLDENYGYWAASTQTALKTQIDQLMMIGWSDMSSKSRNGWWSHRNGHDVYDRLVPYTIESSWWQRTYDLARSMGLVKEFLVQDNFQDNNYTAYPAWSAASGTWTFAATPTFTGITTQPDTIINTSVSDLRSRLITDCGANDYEITAQCKINQFGTASTGPQLGLIGRYTDANNFYIAKYNDSTRNAEIIEVKNNVWTTLATSSTTFALNTGSVYFLRFSLSGNQLKFWINNNLKVSAMGSAFTNGRIGLFSKFTEVMYDDVFVTKPARE